MLEPSKDPERPPRRCASCGRQARPEDAFCVSCGAKLGDEHVEHASSGDGTNPDGRAAPPGGHSGVRRLLSPKERVLALYASGAVVFVVVAYLIFSLSIVLGVLLVVLSAGVLLVVRRSRGSQTGFERRVFEESERYGRSAQKAYEEGKHEEIARGVYQRSKRAYEEANDKYRRANRAVAASMERRRLRSEFERYGRFFRSTHQQTDYFLGWWNQYEGDRTSPEKPTVSDLLRDALDRAYVGMRMQEQQEETFDALISTENFREAEDLLAALRSSQDGMLGGNEGDGPPGPLQPVLEPLNLVVVKLRGVDGWSRYKEEYHTFVMNSIRLLDSPVINAAIRAEEERIRRFPDPNRVAQPKPKGPAMTREDWVALGVAFLVFNQAFNSGQKRY